MEATIASRSRYYRPELDVIRFVAFIFVYLVHTIPDSNRVSMFIPISGSFARVYGAFHQACAFGVSLFFTLSAFLICELLLRERAITRTVSVKQFYIRRILRIWPLYYFALALGAILSFLPGGHPSDVIRMSWFVVFLGAWQVSMHGMIISPMCPLWSVSVEEQFYLFMPWVVKYFTTKLIYGFCALSFLSSVICLYILGQASASDTRVWFDALVQFQCFSAGITACLLLRGQLPRFAIGQRIALLAGGWFCWWWACYQFDARMLAGVNPGSWPLICGYTLASLGSVLMLVAFLGVDSKLMPGWAIYLGRISYGLYVYHEFALYITNRIPYGHLYIIRVIPFNSLRILLYGVLSLGLPFGLTLLMASLSYRYLESPFLKMKKRHAVIESQPIAGAS